MIGAVPKDGTRSSRGAASLRNESFFWTPRERREAYLRNAAGARGIADRAHSESVRQRYLALALFWTTLANEVPGVPVEELTGQEAR